MRPPKANNTDFERIQKYDEWIPGVIEEIKLEENRRTGFKDDKTGADKYVDQVRFKFQLDGLIKTKEELEKRAKDLAEKEGVSLGTIVVNQPPAQKPQENKSFFKF